MFGSAVAAFNEICPDRVDLLHPHYRRLCKRLVDADQWGQMLLLKVLQRYARSQFLDPRADPVTGEVVEASASAKAPPVIEAVRVPPSA